MEGIDNGNSVGTKVQAGDEDKIRTTLSKKDQKELAISDKMWEYYTGIPGWLPIV